MKLMIDLQWAPIQIAALSGAAKLPEFIDEPPGFEEDKTHDRFSLEADKWFPARLSEKEAGKEAERNRQAEVSELHLPHKPQAQPQSKHPMVLSQRNPYPLALPILLAELKSCEMSPKKQTQSQTGPGPTKKENIPIRIMQGDGG